MRVLTVCTANVCRSPMAAALLDRQCRQRGLTVEVRSAGTQAGIAGVEPVMLDAMAVLDLDLTSHVPRLLDREVLATEGRDLVVTMTREHLRTVATMAPGVLARTFTAKELARRVIVGTAPTADGRPPTVAGWLACAADGRSIRNLMGSDPDDDVEDPYGTSLANHRRTAHEIDGLMSVVAGSLAMWLARSFEAPSA